MAEGERSRGAEVDEERPLTAQRDMQPGNDGHSRQDMEEHSLDKSDLQDSLRTNSNAISQNSRMSSISNSNLPHLPISDDSSLLYHESHDGRSEMRLDDSAMERHLNDVEPSFMPATSPLQSEKSPSVDNSHHFDRATAEVPVRTKEPEDQDLSLPPLSPPTPANAYKTPGPGKLDDSVGVGDTTSSLETLSSSPTAAAAARTVSRAISMASVGYSHADEDAAEDDLAHERWNTQEDGEITPRKRKAATLDNSFGDQSLDPNSSTQTSDQHDAGRTPGAALFGNRASSRPKFLRSRHSKHSSVSSFITNPESHDGSDATLGADYALQSGGAVPTSGTSRNSSMGMGLSRQISLGSMASALEERGESQVASDGTLATLTEEEQNRRAADASLPSTPRPSNRVLAGTAPTDTIIARHVRNVQVPESLAKEYRNKSGATSPRRNSGFATTTLGRSSKNMTLKEQSSTIERLSKENFDLKLKVMFLSDRLDKLSEEGVKEMISENVELKTGLAVMQRDNKALKRRVKELEKQLKDDEERPSTAISGTSTNESPRWFDQEGAQEREEELIYLRERVEEYVIEIEKLRNDSMARENEKRNLAEVVRNMGERRTQNIDSREEMDVWKDLLEQETSRREQADEDNQRLRDEMFRLKSATNTGLNHTTNIYNITKKRQVSPT